MTLRLLKIIVSICEHQDMIVTQELDKVPVLCEKKKSYNSTYSRHEITAILVIGEVNIIVTISPM